MRDAIDRPDLQPGYCPADRGQQLTDGRDYQVPGIGGQVVLAIAGDLHAVPGLSRDDLNFVEQLYRQTGGIETGAEIRRGGRDRNPNGDTGRYPVRGRCVAGVALPMGLVTFHPHRGQDSVNNVEFFNGTDRLRQIGFPGLVSDEPQ